MEGLSKRTIKFAMIGDGIDPASAEELLAAPTVAPGAVAANYHRRAPSEPAPRHRPLPNVRRSGVHSD